MKLNLELKLVGYEISTASEYLGYNDSYCKPEDKDKVIDKYKKEASKMIVDIENDEIYVKEIYEVNGSDIIGINLSKDYIEGIDIDENKKYHITNSKKIKVYFSEESKNFASLSKNELKPFKVIPRFTQVDEETYIYKINNEYYYSGYGILSKIDKDLYRFVEKIK